MPRATNTGMADLLPRLEFIAQAAVLSETRCPYCGCADLERIARKYWVIRIARCSACYLLFTDPIYRPLLLTDFYDRWYSAEGSTTKVPQPAEVVAMTRQGFAGSDKDATLQLAAIARLTDHRGILEFGSSWGYFLAQASRAGFNAAGVEVAESRREFGKRVLQVRIEERIEDVEDHRTDVLYTAHTLEHLTEPAGMLERFNKQLAPGGWLVVEVPNCDFEALGERMLHRMGAVHPLGFSAGFFQRALPAAAFELRGIYEDWKSVPVFPTARPDTDVIIVCARKVDELLPAQRPH